MYQARNNFKSFCDSIGVVCDYQTNTDFTKYKYFFKFQYYDSKYISIGTDDFEKIDTIRKQFHHIYEVLPQGVAVREYYDIDLADNSDISTKNDKTHEIIKEFLEVRNESELSDQTLSKKDLVVMTSHRADKLSIHILSKRTRFENNQHQKLFIMDLSDRLREYGASFEIDTSVYSKNRLMRCLGSSKLGKNSKLIVFEPSIYSFCTWDKSLLRLEETEGFEMVKKYKDIEFVKNNDFKESSANTEHKDVEQFLSNHPEHTIRYESDGIIKLDRIESSKCLCGNERIHETQDAFIYEQGNVLFYHCYCGVGNPIRIGYHDYGVCMCDYKHPDMTRLIQCFTSKNQLESGNFLLEQFAQFLWNYSVNRCYETFFKLLVENVREVIETLTFEERNMEYDWAWAKSLIPPAQKQIHRFLTNRVNAGIKKDKIECESVEGQLFKPEHDIYQFVQKYRLRVFPSYKAAGKEFVSDFDKYVKKTLLPDCFVINTGNGKCDIVENIKTPIRWMEPDPSGKLVERSCNLLKGPKNSGFFESCHIQEQLPLYKNMTFKPNPDDVLPGELNMYQGFQASLVEVVNMDIIEPILTHMKTCWADDNEDLYDYLLHWFMNAFRYPWVKTGIVLLIEGVQGSGKGMLVEFIKDMIYGSANGVKVEGLTPITQRFNSVLLNKLFCWPDEVGCDNFHLSWNTLKALITDPTMCIEKKGIDILNDYPNNLQFIMTTNEPEAVKLGQTDRRYVCLSSSPRYVKNWDYFDRLAGSFTQEAADHFYTYCFNYKKTRNLRDIPMTSLKEEMLETSRSNVLRFADNVSRLVQGEEKYDDIESFADEWDAILMDNLSDTKIPRLVFYKSYSAWCKANGEKQYSNKFFGTKIKKVFQQTAIKGKRYYNLK